jgi:hypothetical protein
MNLPRIGSSAGMFVGSTVDKILRARLDEGGKVIP